MTDQIDTQLYSVLCADIVGSTKLYESLGDLKARALIASWLGGMSECIEKHQGQVVSNIGDEILCLFEKADAAVAAACDIQQHLQEITSSGHIGSGPVQVKIGVHIGKILQDQNGVSGDNIKIARWITGLAKPEQILVSRQVFDALPRIFQSMARFVITETWIDRNSREVDILEVIWTVDDLTAHAGSAIPEPRPKDLTVELCYAGEHISMGNKVNLISVGRNPNNNLVVDNSFASRLHFTLTLKRGRCVLEDKSTNGCFVIDHADRLHHVHLETFPLQGSGKIFLAHPKEAGVGDPIEYHCE